MTHDVLKQFVLTPRSENAEARLSVDYETDEITLTWVMHQFDYEYQFGPSERKQKLLDAGYSDRKADKILNALGEV